MTNLEIQNYISQSRLSGMSDDQIKQNLISSGWSENDVNSALYGTNSTGLIPTVNPKGEKNLIWGILLPLLATCLAILSNIVVLIYSTPYNVQGASWLLPLIFVLWVFPIIGWILFGLGCSRYAKEKGYWAGLGWILGIIFSVVGLIILAILPNKNSAGHPEKILTRRVIILFVILLVLFTFAIILSIYKGKHISSSVQKISNSQYSNATLPPTQDNATQINFPGGNYGVVFSYPSNLFDIYDSFKTCNAVTTCPNFTQYITDGNIRYWFAGLFAGQGKAGSMTISLLLDYNDINQVPVTKLFGSGVLTPITIGNKSGNQLIVNKDGCSQIYYIVPGGTVRYPDDLGTGHNGSNLVVITFDGCSTGTAVNNNQNYINSILSTFSIN